MKKKCRAKDFVHKIPMSSTFLKLCMRENRTSERARDQVNTTYYNHNFLLLLGLNHKLSDSVPEGTWLKIQNGLPSKLKEKGKTELQSFCLQTAFYLPTDCLQIYNSVGYLLALYKCMYFCCWFTDVFDKALCKGTVYSDNFWRRIIIFMHSSLQEIFCGGDNGQA